MRDSKEQLHRSGPPPDWNEIFALRPDLEPPGYNELVQFLKNRQPDMELEILREKIKQIHKEKVSTRNKNRSARKYL